MLHFIVCNDETESFNLQPEPQVYDFLKIFPLTLIIF